MKILVSSSGATLDSAVDQRFGRAANFLVFDTELKSVNVLENRQNLHTPQGAGIQAGQQAVNSGAQAVLTGHCGPKAFAVLNEAGIQVCTGASGTVRQAIDDYLAGGLKPAHNADVNGHWV